jgi:hypothetical protein
MVDATGVGLSVPTVHPGELGTTVVEHQQLAVEDPGP